MSEWHLHLDVLALLLLLEGTYLLGLRRFRPSYPGLDPLKPSQVVLFSLGLGVVYLAEGTPLHELSEQYLFSAHMVQHLLLTLVVPPLLLLGTPAWLLRPLLRYPTVVAMARLLTSPLVAAVLFNAVLAFWHVPALYEGALRHHNVHIGQHLTLILSAVLMWWPVLSPLPELPRLSFPLQMLYLFVQSMVPAVLAWLITFSGDVLYPTYGAAPRVGDLSALADQQLGGLIMKIVGSLILWLALGIVFFRWVHREESPAQPAAPLPSLPLPEDTAQQAIMQWEALLKQTKGKQR